MALGLRALGPAGLAVPLASPPGPWCRDVPLWGNPLLQLEHPATRRTVTWPVTLTVRPAASHIPHPPGPRGPRQRLPPPPIHLSTLPQPAPLPHWTQGFGDFRQHNPTISSLGDALITLASFTSSVLPGQGAQCYAPFVASLISLLAVLPTGWVEAARAASLAAEPLPHLDAVRPIVACLGWQPPFPQPTSAGRQPPQPIVLCSESFSVRSATGIQLADSLSEQRQARVAYVGAALNLGLALGAEGPLPFIPPEAQVSGLAHLEVALSTLWRIPWDNLYKETLWRLTVNGVSGAGGHNIACARPCACGWTPATPATPEARASALRSHCFWGCPVAQAVMAEVMRGLPHPSPPICGADIWLLRVPPSLSLHPGIWAFVCMVAIHAMERGRRCLWRTVLGQHPAAGADLAAAVQQASRAAAAWFWCLLQDFVDLQQVPDTWGGSARRHPFISVTQGRASAEDMVTTLLRLNLPVELALPVDLVP